MAQPGQDTVSAASTISTGTNTHLGDPKGSRLNFGNALSDPLRDQFDLLCHSDTLTREPANDVSCIDFHFIDRKTQVLIECNGVITDNDDTVLLHTGEYIHDGHEARFARALSQILVERHRETPDSRLLNDKELQTHAQTGSIFTPDTWNQYRAQTGKSEETVLRSIVTVAMERYEQLKDRPIDPNEYRLRVNEILHDHFDSFMQHVQTDDGLISFFKEISRAGLPVAGCSASSEIFGERALRAKNIRELFDAFIWGAVKKTGEGNYSGDAILRACEAIRVKPGQAIMLGDTMNDIGAAKLAGIPLTIIRLPGSVSDDSGADANLLGMMQSDLSNQVETFGRRDDYRRRMSVLHNNDERPTVLLVHDFIQVRLGSKLDSRGRRATYRTTLGEDTI